MSLTVFLHDSSACLLYSARVFRTCLCVCFFGGGFARGTFVRGLAQGSTPPRGWHSECIITINEKVNGAFSYISIYIWTIWAPQMMSGRSQPMPLSAEKKKQGGLMCFRGHQMLWIMTRPLNANQMTLDRPWSTMPAWQLSPTDTIKRRGGERSLHLSDMM